ncbi:MAG TPA: sialidase family protein [Acidimicrobiales bacterium]|nr:sialidase family protein [Acidimicrobiales bacterium]
MRVLAMLLAGTLVVGCGEATDSAGNGPDSRPPIVTVATVDGVPELATAVATGDTVIGQTWAWGDHPLVWSNDDGENWQPSTTPSLAEGARTGVRLVQVGSTSLLLQEPNVTSEAQPAIWWSDDAGHSFHEAVGVSGGEAGAVSTAVGVGDHLVAFGMVRPGGPPAHTSLEASRSVRWESDDAGRTWSRTDLSPRLPLLTSVVATAIGTLVAATAPGWSPAAATAPTVTMRSTDDGRTWDPVAIPKPGPNDAHGVPVIVDDTVYVAVGSTTWASTDGGSRWTELGGAPAGRDSEGTAPEGSSLQVQARAGDVLVAQVRDFFDYEHYLGHLAWSDDDGSKWHRVGLPVHCDGYDATSTVSDVAHVDGVLVASWNCSGGGDRGGWLLTSTDDGRTWQVEAHKATAGMELSGPVAVDGDHVLLWAGPNAEAAPKVMLTVQPAR